MNKIIIRDYNEGDRNFIYGSWLHGLYFGHDWIKEIQADIFFKEYQKIVEKIMDRATIKVATLPDAEDVALGYVVYQGVVLHWIFVKDAWRKMGIARSLYPKEITTVTHLNKTGRTLRIRKNLIFNPFL